MSDSKVLEEFYKIITTNKQEMFDRIAAERTKHITVVMENVYQEHNASAIIRTCDCFGIQELHVIERDNQYKIQRDIALGAGRWVDMFNYNLGEQPEIDCIKNLKNQGYRIVATSPHTNDYKLSELPIDKPFALVFGTERRGISDEMKDLADDFVSIPMYGFTESFNVSVSVALALQMLRYRLEASKLEWKLSEKEQTLLKIKWCSKILNGGSELEKFFRNNQIKQ
jgi:tRNA (guanosine-2'-O-)-methyltransferase